MVERQNELHNKYECTIFNKHRVNIICITEQKRHKEKVRSLKIESTTNDIKESIKKCYFSHTKINEAKETSLIKINDTKIKGNA